MMLSGFDIKKQMVHKEQHFSDLFRFSRRFFISMVLKNFFGIILVHIILYFGLHFFVFRTSLPQDSFFYTTFTNSPELLTTNLICSIYIGIRFFLTTLFREKHDYVTIHAWYSITLLYSSVMAFELFSVTIHPSWLWQYGLLAELIALSLSYGFTILFRD
jgi:hypothetical protein